VEEKKTTVIPLVTASEQGRAQACNLFIEIQGVKGVIKEGLGQATVLSFSLTFHDDTLEKTDDGPNCSLVTRR
jgi:hypothetical protein